VVSRAERSRSFGSVADDYDRLRPGPPPEAVPWLLGGHAGVVVDLGAGTGLLSRAIAPLAGRVIAVEPDDRMRAVLADRSPGVQALKGSGESIPLPDASADAVLVSAAWHWMDPALATAEVGRVLRDGGRLGITGTGRDRASWLATREWFAGGADDGPGHSVGERDREGRRTALPGPPLFTGVETATFRFTRTMAVGDLIDWMFTYSRVITSTEEAKAAARARATAALAEQFPGARQIEVPMLSRCWRADRAARSDL
jgi:SAM-dependent methyltransferase